MSPTDEVPLTAPIQGTSWSALEHYLRSLNTLPMTLPDHCDMTVHQFTGGHANLTYKVSFADISVVVRRPPSGPLPAGGNDMQREYRVLNNLGALYPPAPRAYAFCDDKQVIGAPFLVSEYRTGTVVRDAIPPVMLHHDGVELRISYALVDAMAALHAVEIEGTALSQLGRPIGFLDRQLKGWKQRWDHITPEIDSQFDAVWEQLKSGKPESMRTSVVHNDFKLDNCQFDHTDPDNVTAVFDWDMATLGDPLVDLGNLLGYWQEAHETIVRLPTRHQRIDRLATRDQLVERYHAQTGSNVDRISWYEAFALWRNAVVFKQLAARYARGETDDDHYKALGDFVPPLIDAASSTLSNNLRI